MEQNERGLAHNGTETLAVLETNEVVLGALT